MLSVPLREGYGRIPRGTLLPLDAVDLTDKLVSYYLEAYGAELTALVLRDMGMQEVAEQLQETMSKGEHTPATLLRGPGQSPFICTLLPALFASGAGLVHTLQPAGWEHFHCALHSAKCVAWQGRSGHSSPFMMGKLR